VEDGVVVVEVGLRRQGDEELAAVGARPGIGHRDYAFVVAKVGTELVLEPVTGVAGAGAEGTAALDHEWGLGNHTVEVKAVVVTGLGEETKVVDGLGGLFGVYFVVESALAICLEI